MNHLKVFQKIFFASTLKYTQVKTIGKVRNLFSFSKFYLFVFEGTLKILAIMVSNAHLEP